MWSPGLWNLQLSFQYKGCDFSFISVSTVKLNKLCCGLPTAGWEFCKCFYFCCPCDEKSSFRSKQVQFNSPAQTQTLQHYKLKLQRFSLLSAELFFKGSSWPRLLLQTPQSPLSAVNGPFASIIFSWLKKRDMIITPCNKCATELSISEGAAITAAAGEGLARICNYAWKPPAHSAAQSDTFLIVCAGPAPTPGCSLFVFPPTWSPSPQNICILLCTPSVSSAGDFSLKSVLLGCRCGLQG